MRRRLAAPNNGADDVHKSRDHCNALWNRENDSDPIMQKAIGPTAIVHVGPWFVTKASSISAGDIQWQLN